MVQKILRTMQDDLREAKEDKTVTDARAQKAGEAKSDAAEEAATAAKKQASKETEPIQKKEVEHTVKKEAAAQAAAPASATPQPAIPPKNDPAAIRNELETLATSPDKARPATSPAHPKDEELSNLIKRVSASMAGSAPATAQPVAAPPLDKDRELKELIERMSKSMEKEEEILKQEKAGEGKPQLADSDEPKKGSATSLLKNVFHKIENGLEGPEQEAAAPSPQDTYWEKMHDTLHSAESSPEKTMMEEIKKEIMLDPKPLPRPSAPAPAPQNASPKKAELIAPEEEVKSGGLIVPAKGAKPAPVKPEEEASRSAFDYMSPENRLIFGKQEYYSSLRKRVKMKTEEKSLAGLGEVLKQDEVKLSDAEEKKMLRHQIVKKYNINLFKLPWAKIIIFAVLFLSTIGAGLYLILPKVTPVDEAPVEIITGENIAAIDAKLTAEVSAKRKTVTALNYFDGDLAPWKSFNSGDIVELKIKYDDHDVLLPRDEALKAVLGQEQFENIPDDFLGYIDQKYSILVYKNGDLLRLGIVLEYDQSREEDFRNTMLNWEATNIQDEKIYSVMKALFTSSRLIETNVTTFQPAIYQGPLRDTELKYVNLPDTDTSMDYVISDNLIFFTTSKDTTFETIDLVQE